LRRPTLIFADEKDEPPALLTSSSFRDEDARAAARKIQVRWRDVPERPLFETIGLHLGERCMTHINRPAISGDFAFVGFSTSGGTIGVYAFKRPAGKWHVAERVIVGYW